MKRNSTVDMLSGPFINKVILFSVPLMISSILQLLFNAADVVVVGRYAGEASLAAVGSTSSLINLTVNVFMGLSVGANVVVARFIGARDYEKTQDAVHTSMLLAIIGGFIVTLIGILFSKQLLTWMDSPADVIGLASLYLDIYFLGTPGVLIYNFGAAILRAKGETKRPLYFLSVSGIINVILNLVFVIYFDMDVAGVALATIISQYVAAILIVIYMINEESSLKLEFKKLRLHWQSFKEILRIGLPAGIQGSIFSLSNVVIQSSINSFGSTVMAGSAAASNIEGFVYASMNSLYQACISFVSQNVGAKKYDNILKIVFTCLGIVVTVGLVLGLGCTIFGKQLINIYNSNPEVIATGVIRLKYICSIYFLCGIMDVMVGALRGIGSSVIPMIVSLCGACGFRLLWIYLVCSKYHKIELVYVSYPISWILTFTFHIIFFIYLYRRMMKKVRSEQIA